MERPGDPPPVKIHPPYFFPAVVRHLNLECSTLEAGAFWFGILLHLRGPLERPHYALRTFSDRGRQLPASMSFCISCRSLLS